MEYSGAGGKLIHEKNQKQKISWHCPFKCKVITNDLLIYVSHFRISSYIMKSFLMGGHCTGSHLNILIYEEIFLFFLSVWAERTRMHMYWLGGTQKLMRLRLFWLVLISEMRMIAHNIKPSTHALFDWPWAKPCARLWICCEQKPNARAPFLLSHKPWREHIGHAPYLLV